MMDEYLISLYNIIHFQYPIGTVLYSNPESYRNEFTKQLRIEGIFSFQKGNKLNLFCRCSIYNSDGTVDENWQNRPYNPNEFNGWYK